MIRRAIFDLSQPGLNNVRGVWAESEREQNRYVKHLTIRAIRPR